MNQPEWMWPKRICCRRIQDCGVWDTLTTRLLQRVLQVWECLSNLEVGVFESTIGYTVRH